MARALASALLTFSWMRTDSATWLPMVCTGDSELIGSWKIIAMSRPRMERMAPERGSSWARSIVWSSPAPFIVR